MDSTEESLVRTAMAGALEVMENENDNDYHFDDTAVILKREPESVIPPIKP